MKLIEALQIANAPQDGPPFTALLACGFTPLHLQIALKAHLRMACPQRTVSIRTGLYGDLGGTLERVRDPFDAIFVVLEWADLDPRLGWRLMGPVGPDVPESARARLEWIGRSITSASAKGPVVLTLPALPLPPVFHVSSNEWHPIEASLWQMVNGLAAAIPATVLRPQTLSAANGHDLKAELASGFPYHFRHADALASELVRLALPQAPKKGLITDLDETLWKGILGDDGPDRVSWSLDAKSQFHALYQHLLNSLAASGVLIGVASKNDSALVAKAFERRDLIVQPAHMFPIEAHWSSKAESVARILQTWNVGADSVVFVYDNSLELESVKAAFPDVECVQFRRDDAELLLKLRDRFAKRHVTAEDQLRTESIRGAEAVRQAVASPANLDTLLSTADARIVFRWGKQPGERRVLELINKTNQFNLNGARYTESSWKAFLSDPATQVVVADYEDRFGKLGQIAVIAGRECKDGGFDVDVWVMSCRAFSRRIEHQCLKSLLARWTSVRLRFMRTERNGGPVAEFVAAVAPDLTVHRTEFNQRCPPLFHRTEHLDV